MRRLIFAGLLMVGSLGELVQGTTYASFTSAVDGAPNGFSAGTLNLGTNPTSALITLSNMVPGDSVTAPLTVSNTGTLDLRYALSSSVTNSDGKALGGQLSLAIKQGVSTCTGAGFGVDGTTLYSGPLGSLSGTLSLIGNPSTLAGRTVVASQSEALCFQAALPSSVLSPFSTATTTATFTVQGFQASGT